MASKAGPVLAEVGVIILLAWTLFGIQLNMIIGDWPPYLWQADLSIILTFIWAAGIITGIVLFQKDIAIGKYLIIGFGSIATVGAFIPLYVYSFPPVLLNIIPLNSTFFYFDVILILVGGILAITLGGRD